MKVLVLIGHQQVGSFCHGIAAKVVERLQAGGHEVVYHDLYAEGFDPILPHAEIPREAPLPPAIAKHCEEVAAADGYVVIHPNWWGQAPAILKGWLDRVFRQGVVYRFGPQGVVEMLTNRRALVFTTSNTPREVELSVFGDPLENFWKTVVFGFCGVKQFERRNFESVIMSTPEQRAQWLCDVERMVDGMFSNGG